MKFRFDGDRSEMMAQNLSKQYENKQKYRDKHRGDNNADIY